MDPMSSSPIVSQLKFHPVSIALQADLGSLTKVRTTASSVICLAKIAEILRWACLA